MSFSGSRVERHNHSTVFLIPSVFFRFVRQNCKGRRGSRAIAQRSATNCARKRAVALPMRLSTDIISYGERAK